jgi:hypothetical protein
MDNLTLHTVVIKKPIDLETAKEMAAHFIPNEKLYHEYDDRYIFKNYPISQFKPGTFHVKKVNDHVSLVLGKHNTLHGSGFMDDLTDKLFKFVLKYNPISISVRKALDEGLVQKREKRI